jgi:hypothetical protein
MKKRITGFAKPGTTAKLSAPLAVLLLAVSPCPSAWPAEKNKDDSHALLMGSVFTADGLSLPGIKVSVKRKDDKKPRWRAVSDRRGEFALRLPAGTETYEVTAGSKGFESQTKTVEFRGSERVDVFFRLARKDDAEEKNKE